MTLVELLVAMTLSVLLLGVLFTAMLLVLRTSIGESPAATSTNRQNGDLIPAQLEANAGVQRIARTFNTDILNVVNANQVTTTGLSAMACAAPSADPKLASPDVPVVRITFTDDGGLLHKVDYRYSRNVRNTDAILVRYECQGTAASIGTATATADKIAGGLSSTMLPTFGTSVGAAPIKTYTLGLTNLAGRGYHFDATMRADATATLAASPPPSPAPLQTLATALQMLDRNGNGLVDAVTATFGTASTTGCASGWTLGGTIPSGGAQGAPTTQAGSTVTVPITEGTGPQDTAVGSLTVTFRPDPASCTNLAPLTGKPVDDGAGPVVTALAQSPVVTGHTLGKMESGDSVAITFSEMLNAVTIPTSVTVTEVGGKSTGQLAFDTVQIAGAGVSLGKDVTAGPLSLGTREVYLGQSKNASFAGTALATATGGRTTVTVTLTGTCTNNVNNSCTSLAAGIGALDLKPATTLTDAAGNAAVQTSSPVRPGANWPMF